MLIRFVDATSWRRRHPVMVALFAAGAIPLGLAMLLLPGSDLLPALGFALLIGTGGGLSSIVRGSVPVVLFGTVGLGLRLGQLAAMRTVLGAAAPALFAFAAAGLGIAATLGVTLAVAAGFFSVMLWLWLELRVAAAPVRPAAAEPPPTS